MNSNFKYWFRFIIMMMIISIIFLRCGFATPTSGLPIIETVPPFKVAIILPRDITTDGWSKLGYEGLLLAEKELDVEIAYSDSVLEAEFETIFRQYAKDGYNFIIGHGGQFVSAAEIVATEFPQTKFAVVTKYEGNNKNLGALSIRTGDMAYLLGCVAALKSTTNKIALMGPVQSEPNKEMAILFERGAKDINPNIEVLIDWVGSYDDTVKAKQLAEAAIANGADVLLPASTGSNLVVHQLAVEKGVYTIGWLDDLHEQFPNTILTTNLESLPLLVLKGVSLAREGRWEGKQYKFGLPEGVVNLTPFYGLLSPEEVTQINAIKQDIMTGKINTLP